MEQKQAGIKFITEKKLAHHIRARYHSPECFPLMQPRDIEYTGW